jgi:endonuclease YncB( thermonuclease family)
MLHVKLKNLKRLLKKSLDKHMKKIFFIPFLLSLSLLTLMPDAWAQGNPLLQTSGEKLEGTVEQVINSATLRLSDGRKIKLIGLIPIDRPKRKELPRNEYNIIIEIEDPIVSFEQTAYDFIDALVTKKDIRLEFDNLYRDPEGYILAYVFLSDGTFVNAEIIRQGFSNLRITPPNKKYEQKLREAYLEAKNEKRGLQGN